MDNIKNKINEYKGKFQTHGVWIKSLKWNSYKTAALRYKEIVNNLPLEGKSVLDVGCWFGDIIPYINSRADIFSYLWVDMMQEFIDVAKQKYPDFDFVLGDYFGEYTTKKRFDIVLCCGALNSNLVNVVSYRKKNIKKMFDSAKECMVFNMAWWFDIKNKKDSKVYYADVQDIFKYCLSLTKKIILKTQYSEKDFTIYMFK